MTVDSPAVALKVYASAKRPHTYLYLPAAHDPDEIPETLAQLLGGLRFALALELTPTRELANASAPKVLAAIVEQGFYVQMPPPLDRIS